MSSRADQDPDEERDWQHLTTEQFITGYAEEDAIYDQLLDQAPPPTTTREQD